MGIIYEDAFADFVGGQALRVVCPQRVWAKCLRVHFGDVPKDERRKVREQLERYCGQDTEGMIWVVDALRKHGS